MKKHQLILEDYVETFKQRVDEFCGEGWLIVAGSVTIKETDSGHCWFSCVMESQDEPGPELFPWRVGASRDEERQASNKFCATFGVGIDASKGTTFDPSQTVANWIAVHRLSGTVSAAVCNSILRNFQEMPIAWMLDRLRIIREYRAAGNSLVAAMRHEIREAKRNGIQGLSSGQLIGVKSIGILLELTDNGL